MTAISVSVVIVSRDRPALLQRCLSGLFQMGYPAFEIIVATNADGIEAVNTVDPDHRVKRVYFNAANISEARNRACDHAAGEVVAFIDDDAVPEPTWLDYLIAPFEDPQVGVAGGFVRGRNGISWQWQGRRVELDGVTKPVSITGTGSVVFAPPKSGAVKTEGTNMAVRRDALVALGGFDPAFRFFLDETDLNLRLGRAGWYAALAPMAQVHHGFAASDRRRSDRAPTDLFEIGASWAVFLKKHLSETDVKERLAQVARAERKRALVWLQRGGLDAVDVWDLLRGFAVGVTDGHTRAAGQGHVSDEPHSKFLPFPPHRRVHHIFSGWSWERTKVLEDAQLARESGAVVSVFLFSPTALFHRLRFTDAGLWLQTGGLWGKSDRTQPMVILKRFHNRLRAENERLAGLRALQGSNQAKKSDK